MKFQGSMDLQVLGYNEIKNLCKNKYGKFAIILSPDYNVGLLRYKIKNYNNQIIIERLLWK